MEKNASKNGRVWFRSFRESRISAKLFALVGTFLIAFGVFAALAWNTLATVKVNGPYYKNIVQSKDLIADILPPPEYLIESYLVVLQMAYETDKEKMNALIEKCKALRNDYQTRRDFWNADLPDGEMKTIILKDAFEPGMEFLDKRDREFIPMLLQGDRVGAQKLAHGVLKEKYEIHRAAIDRLVTASNDKYLLDEKAASEIVRKRTILMASFGLGILLFIAILCGIIIRLITSSLSQISSGLDGASKQLSSVSQQMSANAEETSNQATLVSSSSQQVNQSVQTVATGTEEMTAAIREISKSTSDSVRVADSAVKMASQANLSVMTLGQSSEEIGNIIKLITSIAEQTNLLALNAAIEAARAGEAGKGFAVVANEVKELARETAKATEEIGKKIEVIQRDTKGAIESINQIGTIIKQINDIQNTIASAVEEQTVTTNEIAKNISEAARGTSEINSNISGVANAAHSTASGAGDTKTAADELSRMLVELQHFVG